MANYTNLKSLFVDIADAIREKTGETGKIVADDFPDVIDTIRGGSKFPNGTKWTQSNITYDNINCLHYANGIWVAGSSNNSGLYYSTDGINWTQNSIYSGAFGAVHNANGVWVAGSLDDGFYYSTDGMNWTKSNGVFGNVRCLHYANGIWVACVSRNGLYYSTDGMNWTQSNITSGNFECLHNANGVWVAGGSFGNALCYSISWQPS